VRCYLHDSEYSAAGTCASCENERFSASTHRQLALANARMLEEIRELRRANARLAERVAELEKETRG
jgi:ubiquinone biosynthesis protein UbiJ